VRWFTLFVSRFSEAILIAIYSDMVCTDCGARRVTFAHEGIDQGVSADRIEYIA
jgi:hypothetical protein